MPAAGEASTSRPYTAEVADVRDSLLRLRGVVRPWHETLLKVRPASLRRYIDLIESVDRDWPFDPHLLQLICVAGDAVLTHIAPEGIQLHARLAVGAGATEAQVLEALEIAAICGARTLSMPFLTECASGDGAMPPDMAGKVESSRARFIEVFGSLPVWMERQFAVNPGYASALVDLMYAPILPALDKRDRVLICFAVCACPAVLDNLGASFFAESASRYGVTECDLGMVARVVTLLGLHSISYGILPAIAGFETDRVTAASSTNRPGEV